MLLEFSPNTSRVRRCRTSQVGQVELGIDMHHGFRAEPGWRSVSPLAQCHPVNDQLPISLAALDCKGPDPIRYIGRYRICLTGSLARLLNWKRLVAALRRDLFSSRSPILRLGDHRVGRPGDAAKWF